MNSHARTPTQKIQLTWRWSGACTKAMCRSWTCLCSTLRTRGPERYCGIVWAALSESLILIRFQILECTYDFCHFVICNIVSVWTLCRSECTYSSQIMHGLWLHNKYACWMCWHSVGNSKGNISHPSRLKSNRSHSSCLKSNISHSSRLESNISHPSWLKGHISYSSRLKSNISHPSRL